MAIGDYTAAAAAYSSVLALGPNADESGEAWLELGLVHLAAENYPAAVDTLNEFLASSPDSEQVPDAHFLLADALMGDGQPLAAAEEYRAYLASGTVITAYVNEWLGNALHAGGDYEDAAEAYEAAIATAPDRSFLVGARERLALTRVAQGDYEGAIEQYDAILEVAQIDAYRSRIEYQAAETLVLAGDLDSAYDRLLTVVESYPGEQYAYLALVELVNVGRAPDDYLRGVVDYYGGAYGPAAEAFARYMRDYPDSYSPDAHWYAGLSHLAAGSPALAVSEFQALIQNFPGTPRTGDAWIGLAAAYADAGEIDMAIVTYRAFVESDPDHYRAPEALWRAALLLDRSGALEESAAAYMDCHVAYPDSEYGQSALFRSALQYYRLGDLLQAAVAWDTLAEIYPSSDYYAAARYWLGKVRLQQGDLDAAIEALEEAARAEPLGWYGLRALDLLEDPSAAPFPPIAYDPEGPAEGDQKVAEAWLAAWVGLDESSNLGEISGALATDTRLQRGLELWRLRRLDDAKREFEAIRTATAADPVAQYQLALLFRDIGLYRSSILCAARLVSLSPASSVLDVPPFIARLAYPLYYEDLVVQFANAQNLPPLLVFALIRQESLFESLASSSASAHGLMQVMPSTGDQIAAELGWPPGYETSDLYLPYVSVRFGTYYLARQRDAFGGRLEAALAAYNGGPANADRWLETAAAASPSDGEADPDLFVELITLSESRQYVERIKAQLAIYQALYEE